MVNSSTRNAEKHDMLRAAMLIAAVAIIGFALAPAAESDPDKAPGPGLLATLVSRATGADAAENSQTASRGTTQTYWQYTENGTVRFASRLADVPEAWRGRAGRVEFDGPPPDTPAAARTAREARTAHVRLRSSGAPGTAGGSRAQNPNNYPEVVIYTTQSCPHCRKALAHLDRRGVPYVNKDVENDRSAEREYLEKGKGRRGVPLIDIGGKILRGYSPRSLDDALDRSTS